MYVRQGNHCSVPDMRSRRSILTECAKLMAFSTTVSLAASASSSLRWVAFYGLTAPEEVLARYGLVVLDPMFGGSVVRVAQEGARVCSYLSLGEVRMSDAVFRRIEPAALLEENPSWPGTRRIDVRHPHWASLVIDEIIPSIAIKGFTGLLLDTLDTPAFLESSDPAANKGMAAASVELVRTIRRAYPSMMLIVNRGYAILEDIVDSIDMVLTESLLTRPDQTAAGLRIWNDLTDVQLQLLLLAPAHKRPRKVAILSLEYWDPQDATAIREIYSMHRRLGHFPYVATQLLDAIIPEPALSSG